jgi:uncharacterized membrane protein
MTAGGAWRIRGRIIPVKYDLTNLAIVKNWSVLITVVDLAWGTVLSLAVSFVSFMAGMWLR